GDAVACAGDGTVRRVRGRDGSVAGGTQRGGEGAHAVGQRASGRQDGLRVRAAELDRARVTRGGVVELGRASCREGEGVSGGDGGGGADRVVRGRGGADGDAVAGAGDGTVRRVRGRDGSVAGGTQRDGEGARAVGQRAAGRQDGLRVRAAELDRARITRGGVV